MFGLSRLTVTKFWAVSLFVLPQGRGWAVEEGRRYVTGRSASRSGGHTALLFRSARRARRGRRPLLGEWWDTLSLSAQSGWVTRINQRRKPATATGSQRERSLGHGGCMLRTHLAWLRCCCGRL